VGDISDRETGNRASSSFSALTLYAGRQKGHLACKKLVQIIRKGSVLSGELGTTGRNSDKQGRINYG